ncbi:DUF2345 domain-containing protein, partial [Pseudomonas citronellolis]
RSIALGAGEHIDAAAQQHLQLTAGEQMLLNAGQGLGTFAQSGDMRHIAHQGQLLLQAQHNSIRVEADQSVEVSASQQHIVVNAKTHLTLLCGGAYVKIADGNIELGMPGNFTIKAASHKFIGPATVGSRLPTWRLGTLPLQGDYDRKFVATWAGTDIPIANAAYRIFNAKGELIMEGRTNEAGETGMSMSELPDQVSVELLEDQ